MADELSTSEAATLLQTTRQTVRNLVVEGALQGRQVGGPGHWRVRRSSVDRFLREHGPLGGARRQKSVARLQQEQIAQLTDEVARLQGAHGVELSDLLRDRDSLREQLAAAHDTVARFREAAELQRQADEARSATVARLLEALEASERADRLHRQALEVLEDGLAAGLFPGLPPA